MHTDLWSIMLLPSIFCSVVIWMLRWYCTWREMPGFAKKKSAFIIVLAMKMAWNTWNVTWHCRVEINIRCSRVHGELYACACMYARVLTIKVWHELRMLLIDRDGLCKWCDYVWSAWKGKSKSFLIMIQLWSLTLYFRFGCKNHIYYLQWSCPS